jgi:Transglycosylase SLT domain
VSDALPIPLSTRRGRRVVVVGGTLGAPALLAGGLLLIAALTSTSLCTGVGRFVGGLKQRSQLTPQVTRAINEQSARFDVDPYVIGALAMRETAGGAAVSCSSAGACGVMQLMPTFWATNRCDGDGDGRMDIGDVDDNVCAAVNGLLHDKHTLVAGRRMTRAEIATMARSYCGSCTDRACGGGIDGGYCQGVVNNFQRLGGTFDDATTTAALSPIAAATASGGGCTALAAGVPGTGMSGWSVAAGANLPGRPLSPLFTAFMNQVAPLLSYRPVLTTGTNHSQYTVDGNVSDHYTGNAGDFGAAANHFTTNDAQPGQSVPRGDELAAAMFIAAGIDPAQARAWALAGGLRDVEFTFQGQPVRLQVIWKTSQGGNHHDHVHGGLDPNPPEAQE